jgi:outer membrane protein assembly factor BamB
MFRPIVISVACCLAFLPSRAARAVSPTGGLISSAEARRYGLEPMWFTRAQLDAARGQLTFLQYFVSSKNMHTVFELKSSEGTQVFSERDLNAFGEALGKEGAEQKAKQVTEELKAREIEAKVERHDVPEITLYVTTDRGMVQAIDAETGRTRWALVIGERDYPTERPGVSEDFVAVLNGTRLFLLKRDTGEIAWSRSVAGVPGAGPAISDTYVAVPTYDGDVELYDLKETRTLPEIYKSNGRAIVQPIVTTMSIAWPTDRGFLYVARASKQGLRYRLEARDAIVSQPSYFGPHFFFAASIDGDVYCLHENSGDREWTFPSGEAISSTPVPVGESVYVVTDKQNLYCLAQQDGKIKWVSPFIKRFVAASQTRVYCVNRTDRMEVVDAASGGRVATMEANLLDVFYPNLQTDRILVGTRTGTIQCLREIGQTWPLVHAGTGEAAAKRPEIKQEALPQAQPKAAPKQPAGGGQDPFGGGGGGAADPFGGGAGGGGAGGGAAGGGGAGGAADPFGGGGAGGGAADPFGG